MARWDSPPSDQDLKAYQDANAQVIANLVTGVDVHTGQPDDGGVRVVFNVACAHVPGVLRDGYKNRADLEREGRLTGSISERRTRVDAVVGEVCGVAPEQLYYGALELHGAGMRYYGDIALVLTPSSVPHDQALLYRNSYDLEREPIRGRVNGRDDRRREETENLRGEWSDGPAMVLRKAADSGELPAARHVTSARVSRAVLDDEDYIEVPRDGSFGRADIEQARTTAAEVAVDTDLRAMRRNALTGPQLKWRNDRRAARVALHRAGLELRTIGHLGRQR